MQLYADSNAGNSRTSITAAYLLDTLQGAMRRGVFVYPSKYTALASSYRRY